MPLRRSLLKIFYQTLMLLIQDDGGYGMWQVVRDYMYLQELNASNACVFVTRHYRRERGVGTSVYMVCCGQTHGTVKTVCHV